MTDNEKMRELRNTVESWLNENTVIIETLNLDIAEIELCERAVEWGFQAGAALQAAQPNSITMGIPSGFKEGDTLVAVIGGNSVPQAAQPVQVDEDFEEWRISQEPSQLRAETTWQTIERAFKDAYRKGVFKGAAEMQKQCDIDYDRLASTPQQPQPVRVYEDEGDAVIYWETGKRGSVLITIPPEHLQYFIRQEDGAEFNSSDFSDKAASLGAFITAIQQQPQPVSEEAVEIIYREVNAWDLGSDETLRTHIRRALTAINSILTLLDSPEMVERVAQDVYKAMQWAAGQPHRTGAAPDWVANGNSIAQDKARNAANAVLAEIKKAMNQTGGDDANIQ